MDPQSFIARAVAQRWLGFAEELLTRHHDLVGSQTFAIRARDSDPRLEAAHQFLAVVDTLIAAHQILVGNNGVRQPDFYAILQLVRFVQDTDHIASQYEHLAYILNPNQNRFPYSDQAFQLVNDAWAVLSNPMRKSLYDSELDFPQQQETNQLGFNLEQQQHNVESDHEQELPEPQQTFQIRAQRSDQQQQLKHHNFLSQNSVRSGAFCDEQLFQPQVELFGVTSALHQPTPTPPQPPLSQPQASPLSQPQLQPQQQQQHHELPEQNSSPVQLPSQVNTNSNNGVREEEKETEAEAEAENVDKLPTFWTACPYCFYMYEFPRVYEECTIRCDHCKRAYQAVRISSPPSVVEGQEDHFYCWGYFPIGISMSDMSKNNGGGTNRKWTAFSTLHDDSSNIQKHYNGKVAPKKNEFVNKSSGGRVFMDDILDDIFTGMSESSDDSDVEWNSRRR